jgi:glycosyltransferase involved in cell wall biosynthesis
MKEPLISIITVVYNGASTLEQTILSVINQTYKNIEYIIIDGGSTDGTIDIIRKYEDKLAYWVSEQDKGIYDAMNKGIEKATGELIGIINSDDWYELKTVELVVDIYNTTEKEGVYYGFLKIWKEGKEHTIRRFHHNFFKEHMIQHPTWFVSSSIYKKIGKFNDIYKIVGDFELFQRFVRNKVDFFPLDAILSNFRVGGISTYGNKQASLESLKLLYKLNSITKLQYLLKDIAIQLIKGVLKIKKNNLWTIML